MPKEISVRIDGELCSATDGETILEVARANGQYIPALCYMEGLSPAGSCRLCGLEVSGVVACYRPVPLPFKTGCPSLLTPRSLPATGR